MFLKECASRLFLSACSGLIFKSVQAHEKERFTDAREIPILGIDDAGRLVLIEFWLRATGSPGATLRFTVPAGGWRNCILPRRGSVLPGVAVQVRERTRANRRNVRVDWDYSMRFFSTCSNRVASLKGPESGLRKV